jgi:hypothetical protein
MPESLRLRLLGLRDLSEGSSDNLQLLRQGRADLGFVQGGSARKTDDADTASPPVALGGLAPLQGLRVNVGTAGSGVPLLMQALFELNRLDTAGMRLSQRDQTAAAVEFLGGEIDALVFASAPESLMVQMLLQTPGVRLLDFAQNEAYSRRLPFLSPVTLPRGVVDLSADVPPRDMRLVAPTTTLLARPDVHPAILQLFSQASLELHGHAGWFSRPKEFPMASSAEYPLAREAERTIRNGVPLLQYYLPFSLANLLERMWLSPGIIIALLLLSRVVPPLYEFRIRSRVFRWYARLRDGIEGVCHRVTRDGAQRCTHMCHQARRDAYLRALKRMRLGLAPSSPRRRFLSASYSW